MTISKLAEWLKVHPGIGVEIQCMGGDVMVALVREGKGIIFASGDDLERTLKDATILYEVEQERRTRGMSITFGCVGETQVVERV